MSGRCFLLILCFFVFKAQATLLGDTRSDTLIVRWHTGEPFIFRDITGELSGIELDLLQGFQQFMKQEKGVDIYLSWKETDNFFGVIDRIGKSERPDEVGVSAISITEDRENWLQFTQPYLPDVAVLVTHKKTPVAKSYEELKQLLENRVAQTIEGTKYESLLANLRLKLNIEFAVNFISSDNNVIDKVEDNEAAFGFVDLPIYLMEVNKGSDVVRQEFFTAKGQGYGFILPNNSTWKASFDEFFTSPKYDALIDDIISKYLGADLHTFVDQLSVGEDFESILLTKERELQLALMKNENLQMERELNAKNFIIIIVIIVALFLGFNVYYQRNVKKFSQVLIDQKEQIDDQQADIKRKNQQLLNRNSQLVALNEEKNNLIKVLAHDLRSPLSQIMMISDVVHPKVEPVLNEQEKKLFNQVKINADRINQMVTKILDVDSLENEHVKVHRERVDIRNILEDISQRYKPVAEKKGITLEVQICDRHYIIRSDHLLLLLVLENLVSNAVKFSESSTTVCISSKCEYDSVLFTISDEGPGFTEADKKMVFNRFQKLSAKPTGGEKSTGLGLSIVKKYVNDLGGKIWLESQEGKGTTFFVKISV